jgi:predicted MPP superfamily phosphohydrolase
MKTMNVVIFFGVFFTVYALVNFYIFIRGWQALQPGSPARTLYLVLFLFLSMAFVAGRFMERWWLNPATETLVWIGSFWLAAMLYLFLAVLLLDLLRLIHHFVPFFPAWVTADYARFKERGFLTVGLTVVAVIFAGHINALIPQVTEVTVAVNKPLQGEGALRIVAASDIHLGTIIGRRRFEKIVARMNAMEPDLILLPGDIVDEDLAPVIKENLGETLRALRAPLGVYAVTGNHEFIGGAEAAVRYLTEHGVTVLRDSVAELPNGVTVAGREDRSISQFSGRKRKELSEILAGVDLSRAVILMDHQPFHLEEAAAAGVDLQLSGHTHHGQLWPFNYITDAIYEVSRGYARRGNTHYVVSQGIGTWGPPVRLGNRPEILLITLRSEAP